MEIYQIVRQRMRELREANRLSQKEVAQAIGLSAQYYYQLEAGSRNPTLQTIEALAGSYGVPRSYFLTDGGAKAADSSAELIRELLLEAGTPLEDVELVLDVLAARRRRRSPKPQEPPAQ